jgi:uncharacterized membrane protein
MRMDLARARRRAAVAGVLLGIGLGGFLDGIVLHQILQWHHMLSSVLPPVTMEAMQTNMLWDGLFHALVWLATLVGVLLLWSAARHSFAMPSLGWLVGLLFVGWGLFNLVEGVIDHHILGIHHVRGYGPNLAWDLGFLGSGVVFMVFGWALVRTGDTR